MFIIDKLDFYSLLGDRVNEILNDLYLLLSNDLSEKRDINSIHAILVQNLKNRNLYCDELTLNVTRSRTTAFATSEPHETILIIQNMEQILMDMFKKPRICNKENIKFIQMFLTILDNYLNLIYSYEISSQIQHHSLYNTLDIIFKNIKK